MPKEKSHLLRIRIPQQQYEYLQELSKACDGKTMSSLIRQMIWYYRNC